MEVFMKKNIALLTTIILLIGIAANSENNQYNPNRPEWKDFCPFGLENIESYNVQKSLAGTDKHFIGWIEKKILKKTLKCVMR